MQTILNGLYDYLIHAERRKGSGTSIEAEAEGFKLNMKIENESGSAHDKSLNL